MGKISVDTLGNPPSSIKIQGETFDTLNWDKNEVAMPVRGKDNAAYLVQYAVGWIGWIAGVLGLIFIIYGGIMFATSGGDSEKIKKARNILLYAAIGIIVAIMSYGIWKGVASIAKG